METSFTRIKCYINITPTEIVEKRLINLHINSIINNPGIQLKMRQTQILKIYKLENVFLKHIIKTNEIINNIEEINEKKIIRFKMETIAFD